MSMTARYLIPIKTVTGLNAREHHMTRARRAGLLGGDHRGRLRIRPMAPRLEDPNQLELELTA